jgi:hypothetical protein
VLPMTMLAPAAKRMSCRQVTAITIALRMITARRTSQQNPQQMCPCFPPLSPIVLNYI